MDGGTRGGMSEGEEDAAGPGVRLPGVLPEGQGVGVDAPQRGERDGAKRHHDGRVAELEVRSEETRAGAKLAGRGPAVSTAMIQRQAEDSVGDSDIAAVEAGLGEERGKAAAGGVAAEGDARPRGTEATGRLADDEDGRGSWRRLEDGGAGNEARAGAAGAGAFVEVEGWDGGSVGCAHLDGGYTCGASHRRDRAGVS